MGRLSCCIVVEQMTNVTMTMIGQKMNRHLLAHDYHLLAEASFGTTTMLMDHHKILTVYMVVERTTVSFVVVDALVPTAI